MARFHVNSKFVRAVFVTLAFYALFGLLPSVVSAQRNESAPVSKDIAAFLRTWLVDGAVDRALEYVSERPVFPSCWVAAGKNLLWRDSRKETIRLIRPALARLANDSAGLGKLEDIISSQEKKIDPGLIAGEYDKLFDVYRIDNELEERILRDACHDRKHDDSLFLVKGLKRQRESYLVLFHFRGGLLGTMIWTKEKTEFRLLYLDFPLE